jgi:dipeptide/tripeptide permease
MGCGFLCAAVSFEILALSAYDNNGALISPVWIVGAILIQVIGELWIAPLSFSKISQYAPPRFQSILMSFWPMAIAYGHYFAGFIAQYSLEAPAATYSEDSFERYGNFFFCLGLLPLCIGLLLLLYQGLKYFTASAKAKNAADGRKVGLGK